MIGFLSILAYVASVVVLVKFTAIGQILAVVVPAIVIAFVHLVRWIFGPYSGMMYRGGSSYSNYYRSSDSDSFVAGYIVGSSFSDSSSSDSSSDCGGGGGGD